MDNELKLISYLLGEVKEEIALIEEYENTMREAVERAKEEARPMYYYIRWDKKSPSKAKIKDDLKMIRRLTLKIEKEL